MTENNYFGHYTIIDEKELEVHCRVKESGIVEAYVGRFKWYVSLWPCYLFTINPPNHFRKFVKERKASLVCIKNPEIGSRALVDVHFYCRPDDAQKLVSQCTVSLYYIGGGSDFHAP